MSEKQIDIDAMRALADAAKVHSQRSSAMPRKAKGRTPCGNPAFLESSKVKQLSPHHPA